MAEKLGAVEPSRMLGCSVAVAYVRLRNGDCEAFGEERCCRVALLAGARPLTKSLESEAMLLSVERRDNV